MNINKINSTATNFIKSTVKKTPLNLPCDSFEKTPSNATGSLNKKLASLIGIDDIPIFKKAEDFKKPALGILGPSQEKQAYLYNSSEQIQAKTKESIQGIAQYIEKEAECGNIAGVYSGMGGATCELKNGLIIDACEPYNMSCDNFSPLKMLRLKMKDSEESIALSAHTSENEHLIFNLIGMINSIGKTLK